MEKLFKNVSKQSILTMTIGLFLGGIALAYLTNDTEPWGTIGGFISGFSLFAGFILYGKKQQQNIN